MRVNWKIPELSFCQLPVSPLLMSWHFQIVTHITGNHSVLLVECVGQHVWPFLRLRWNERFRELETEDRTQFSHFMYKEIRGPALCTRGAADSSGNTQLKHSTSLSFCFIRCIRLRVCLRVHRVWQAEAQHWSEDHKIFTNSFHLSHQCSTRRINNPPHCLPSYKLHRLTKQKQSQMWDGKKMASTNLFHNYKISNLNTAAFNLHCSWDTEQKSRINEGFQQINIWTEDTVLKI